MLPECQRKIADLYNISIGSVKKLVPTLFHKEKYVIHYEENTTLLETRIKTKKMHRVSEFSQWQWLKPYIQFNIPKRIEAEENNDKDGKMFYKLMNNAIYGKIMKNLRNRINLKPVNNKKTI